jgi:hypothetical protein
VREVTGNQSWETRHMSAPGEAVIDAISVGVVFVLLGLVFVLALPHNLFDAIIAFFRNMTIRSVGGTSLQLPAPANPGLHTVLYTAVFQFTLGVALLQILILILRIAFGSPIRKISETAGSLVFWAGASYLVYVYLNSSTMLREWFVFWAAIIIVLGVSVIVRGFVTLARR